MSEIFSIVIWDYDTARIAAIDRNLHLALKELGLEASVNSLNEPPLMSRQGLVGKEPVLEIDGKYWMWKPNEVIPKEACMTLLGNLVGQSGTECSKK